MFLKGKTALITGSTSGIGLGYAKALAAQGANIMINGFGETEEIADIIKELQSSSGSGAVYSAADMTLPGQIRAMVADCNRELGGPDILINRRINGMPFWQSFYHRRFIPQKQRYQP